MPSRTRAAQYAGTEFQGALEVTHRVLVSAAARGEEAQVVRPVGARGIELFRPLVAAPGLVDVAVRLVEAPQGANRRAVRRVAVDDREGRREQP